MALPSFLNPRNPVLWLTGLVTSGVVVIGATTYNAFFGPAATLLEEYTVPVEVTSLEVRIDASGTVVPVQDVNISPTEAGQLQELLVEQGMPVQQGQRLAVMDNKAILTQGAQAEARLKQAVADLQLAAQQIDGEILQNRARVGAAEARLAEARVRIPTELAQAEANVLAAAERLARAELRRDRYIGPTDEMAIAQNDFDDVALEVANARAALEDARADFQREQRTIEPEIRELEANLFEAEAALRERERSAQAEINSREAAVELARAQIEELRVDFEDTVITAPFDGIITQKYATQGAFVTPTTSGSSGDNAAAATSIVALANGLEVLAKIPEIDVNQVQPGQLVEVVADAHPDQRFRGQVRLLAPEAIVEENVTSFEVRIVLDLETIAKEKIRLLPGMNVDVTFLGPKLARAIVIPTVAVVTEDGETGVMVADARNKPEFRPVVLGSTVDDKTQVVEGLQQNDRVFIDLPEKYRKRESQGRV
ncbi:MAG: efflux RND transporter periplasmic adaptor subunit [Spirulina sp. SIO3F2]|nr:efflux RND transporter periplasmic adaptor subunit [Spirulina sp. SIO3F2]